MSTDQRPGYRPRGRPTNRPATGAARFQQEEPPERRSPFRAFLATLALAGLLLGVPALLVLFAGPPPIPTSVDVDALTGTVSTEQVLSVLVGVVWLAWLHFALCTLVEIVAALRGVRLSPRVPLGGSSQRLARALVAAVLLTGGLATQAAAAAAPTTAGVVASQTASPGGTVDDGHIEVPEVRSGGLLEKAAAPAADAMEQVLYGKKVYTVQPPEGRHHDSLWDIAERHLGDGRRYTEIYQLNEGREQPDGRSLKLARLIQPGWHLVMPEDAVGVARWEAPPPATPSSGPSQGGGSSATDDGGGGPGAGDHLSGDQGGPGGGGPGSGTRTGDEGFVELATQPQTIGGSLAGAGLLAVGLLSALRRSRRRGRAAALAGQDAVETEVWLRVAADEERARRLAQAVRGLPGLCEDLGHALPQTYAAAIDGDAVELFLAPPAPDAPAPWSAVEDGRRWRLERSSAPRRNATGASPFPALVSVGRDASGRDVLINLAAAAGVVSVTGSPVPAGHVVRALAVELATAAWSEHVKVIAVDLPAELDEVRSERLVRVAGVDEALAALSGDRVAADQVVSGRRAAGAEGVDVIVLGRGVDGAEAERLRGIAAAAGGTVAVVAAGELPGARWTFRVDDAGSLHVDALDVVVTASRIDDATLASLRELFAVSGDGTPPDPAPVAGGRPEIPAPPHPVEDAGWGASAARVGLLGPVLVRAPGPIDSSRVDLAAELVAVLAVHPGGVHPSVLGGAVWPRGVTTEVRDATIARVRDWLGTDEQGRSRLVQDGLGRLSLGADVVTDWHLFCSLAGKARLAASPVQERDLLARALRLVRGPLAAEVPSGRYAWLARTGLEITVPLVIVDAAHRLVELLYSDDPGGGAEAARAGLRADPAAQLLWRDLLWCEYSQWGPDGVRSTVGELDVVLRELGVEVEPETGALIEELLPGGPVAVAPV
jgi:hypothetical protein